MVSYAICGVSIHSLFYYFKCMTSSESFKDDISKSDVVQIWEVESFLETSANSLLTLNQIFSNLLEGNVVYLAVYDDPDAGDCDCNGASVDGVCNYPANECQSAKLLYSGTLLFQGKSSLEITNSH